jgi:membrane protease YdiL (CAAX protease family)
LNEVIRLFGPALAAFAAAVAIDRAARRRGLDPPGFADPLRRVAATTLVAVALYFGVFAALGAIGQVGSTAPFSGIADWQLFVLQFIFAATLLLWFALGFVGLPAVAAPAGAGEGGGRGSLARLARQLGFAAPRLSREIGLGVAAGISAWVIVLAGVLVVVAILAAVFGDDILPQAPPAVIPWIAGRPALLKLGIALSAGLVEETFFRGFLQPRIGIVASTILFAMAHLSYDQPLMLVGITLLSLLYGALVKWRQNLWPAIVAHFLFDAIQLLIVIPAVLKLVYTEAAPP